MKMAKTFGNLSRNVARFTGRPLTFAIALGIIVVWGVSGPLFGWSDTWQLVINTGTTIVTFLMVFLIQNTQNRDAEAVHLKLDELIRATRGARNALLDLEELTEEELDEHRKQYELLAEKARRVHRGHQHTRARKDAEKRGLPWPPPPEETMSEVTENTAKGRFELEVEGHTALIAWRVENGVKVLHHTEVPEALGGKGVGGRLAQGVFDLLKARGEKVRVTCPFLVKWLDRNPDYKAITVA
jgi:low affinity Fe/Cu permease/predicted GNAT family acetyltransferase